MHVPALDGFVISIKYTMAQAGWLRGACAIVVDWERGCRCSVGSLG